MGARKIGPEGAVGIALEADLLSAKTIEKKWVDGEGNVHHEDFVEIRLLAPAADLDVAALVETFKRHERCAVSIGSMAGQLSFLDELAHTIDDARAEAAERRKASGE